MTPLSRFLAATVVAGSVVTAGIVGGAAAPALAADCATPVTVDVAALLSTMYGPYGAASIDDALPDSFPLTEPYSTDGTTVLRGGAGNSITSIDDVQDWVVVEVRDVDDPARIIATDTVALGLSTNRSQRPARFFVPPGTYRVAITHRNHLTTMAQAPVALSPATTPFVDFTDPATPMYNQNPGDAGRERVTTSRPGVLQIVPGDVNRDNAVDDADLQLVRQAANRGESGYVGEDITIDGYVDTVDVSYAASLAVDGGYRGSVPVGSLAPVPACDPPVITSAAPPAPSAGTAYAFTVTATGTGTITYAVTGGALPAGLSLDPATGVISGTTTESGTFGFTVSATNDYGADTEDYSFVIAPVASPTPSASPTPVRAVSGPTQLAVTGAADGAGTLVLGALGAAVAIAGAVTVLRRRRAS